MKLRAPPFFPMRRNAIRIGCCQRQRRQERPTANSACPIRDGRRQGCQAYSAKQDRAGPHHLPAPVGPTGRSRPRRPTHGGNEHRSTCVVPFSGLLSFSSPRPH